MTFGNYFYALFLTLLIELSVMFLLGFRSKKELYAGALASLITHPIFGYFLWLNYYYEFMPTTTLALFPIEILISIVESFVLFYVLERKYTTMLFLALTMNMVSFLSGELF